MSKTKKAEIGAQLDSLHISTLRENGDSDLQALYKLISRLDKLSLMGADDDGKDEPKLWRLHNAISRAMDVFLPLQGANRLFLRRYGIYPS